MNCPIKTKLTCVRYPGGKSNALKFLDGYLKKDFSEYREPFFGGGSVGLYLMQFNKTATYWINDLFYPVYCFWDVLYTRPLDLVEYVRNKKSEYVVSPDVAGARDGGGKKIPSKSATNGEGLHALCRQSIVESITKKNKFKTACEWYILNKLSYSGMAMIGSYAPLAWDQNFTDNCISNLPKTSALMHSVKELSITNLDYSELLKNDGYNVFIFLDPPYDIAHSLYGNAGDMHVGFSHIDFAERIKKCLHSWIITYNDSDVIKERFSEYPQIAWDLTYTMKSAKRTESEKAAVKIEHKDGYKPEKSGKRGRELLILSSTETA